MRIRIRTHDGSSPFYAAILFLILGYVFFIDGGVPCVCVVC